MNDLQPGDVVECISVEAPCCGDTTLKASTLPQPVLRRLYRVRDTMDGRCSACGTNLPCMVPTEQPDEEWAWPQMLFRKIEPAAESLFRKAEMPA